MNSMVRSVFCLVLLFPFWLEIGARGYVPSDGFVPNERTAVAIAEAVLIPIYGSSAIDAEKPFHATVQAGVWIIKGTLPQGLLGGVAVVKLAKKDGRILYVLHGK